MEKIQSANKLAQKIERDRKLKKQKIDLLNKYSGYWELPNFCKRQLSELEDQIEVNNSDCYKNLKNVY